MANGTPIFDFDESVLTAVIGHMNTDHRHDSLAIVRALGATPTATVASVATLTADGVSFDVETPDGPRRILVPWAEVPASRIDIRHELVRMTEESSTSPN